MPAPPGKAPNFITFQDRPYSGGPQLAELCATLRTPTAQHFVRNHGQVPAIDPETYRLEVGGLVDKPQKFTMSDLRRKFAFAVAPVTLECAGSRRRELDRLSRVFGEIPWGPQAIGNAIWRGVPLRALLEFVGVDKDARHVEFTGLDMVAKEGTHAPFGGSIPLGHALTGNTLLAYRMNGKPLPPEHGAPLRAVVPGYIGARSVKWLGSITLRDTPSANRFQTKTYKVVGRNATREDWQRAPAIGATRANCAICIPNEGAMVMPGAVKVAGYAHGRMGEPVEGVEVSADGGKTWGPAQSLQRGRRGSWSIWRATVYVRPGKAQLVARVVDGHQPSSLHRAWNAGGYVNNAWHRVRVHVE